MKIGICDDERTEVLKIRKIVEKCELFEEAVEIIEYNPSSLLTDVEENFFDCQILITDIYYGGYKFNEEEYDGVEVAKLINRKYPLCKVIFMSQFADFTEYVYEADHIYFVQKKNIGSFLVKALEKAVRTYREDAKENVIEFFSSGKKTWVKLKDILSVEKDGRNIKILTENGSFSNIKTLKQFISSEDISDEPIERCNSSSLANIRHVKNCTNTHCILDNGLEYDITETYRESFMKAYLRWWKDRM